MENLFRKLLTGFLGFSCLCLPIGNIDASYSNQATSGVTIELTGGDAGFSPGSNFNQLKFTGNLTNNREGETIKVYSTNFLGFGVMDYSGTHSGWSVTVTSSDFINSKNGDKFSDHKGTFHIKCGTAGESFLQQQHISCKADKALTISSTGTTSATLAEAPADSTSANSHWFHIPESLFEYSFDTLVSAGTYTGEITFDFAKVP